MPNQLEGKTIALGVSGSIACHKAVGLASKLTQQGADGRCRHDRGGDQASRRRSPSAASPIARS